MRVERIPPERAPTTGAFTAALRIGAGAPLSFLPSLPCDDAAWAVAVAEAPDLGARTPPGLARALTDRQRVLGAGPRAVDAAEALADPRTLAVVTGQQPGLLGGPLLTFHKAAGALHLARRLDGVGGRRVVPLFWLASEDHDLDEANQLVLLDRQGQPRRLGLDVQANGRSLMHLELPHAVTDALLGEVADVLPDTPRAREVLDLLRRADGEDCASWCARSLLSILGDSGLVLVEPPELLPFAGDALAALLEDGTRIRDAVVARGEELVAAGFDPPLQPGAGEMPLFVRPADRGPRRRVTLEAGDVVRVRGEAASHSVPAMAQRLREDPAYGSGDAVGRVFVQNRLLPVLAYVGGPTELVYHAQVRAAHQAVGWPYPLAVPRPEATWADRKAESTATAFGVDLMDVAAGRVTEPPAVAREEDAHTIEIALARWIDELGEAPEVLAPWIDGEGEGPATLRRQLQRLGREGRRAGEAIAAAFERDRGIDAGRWQRLLSQVRPRGRSQERVLSPVSIAARYGLEALREGLSALDPLVPGHALMHLP